MKIYLVGGAVRDRLLNIPVKDRDWVVVGSTPDELLAMGYQPVGKDFPVFLHPNTHEEYALARSERKSGVGYTGFDCYAGSDVTLEQDLLRRDLTINAIAEDEQGQLIDPYHGQQDIQNKQLRHVSEAFVEDPLRVLRVARFLARFDRLGFSIAEETLQLMKRISDSRELQHLTPERVWTETEKALTEPSPWRYFEALRDCGALAVVFPELNQLFGVPQPPKHHPEVDTGLHVMLTLQAALKLMQPLDLDQPDRIAVLFSLVCHDLGKGRTPPDKLPSHPGHEDISEFLSRKLCDRLRTPNPVKRLSQLVAEYHTHCHRALELKPSTVMRLFEALDVARRPHTLTLFLLACEADARGRTGLEDRPYPQVGYLQDCANAMKTVDIQALIKLGYKGDTLGIEIRRKRIEAIRKVKASYVQD